MVHSYWPNYVYPDLDKSRNDVSPFVFLTHKGDNHDTSKKATFAVTSCSISFIRISAPHSGQSSQLLVDANGGNAQFLATVAGSALILPLMADSCAIGCSFLCATLRQSRSTETL
jgi:hypothetical protein